jgi:hypothetical protein
MRSHYPYNYNMSRSGLVFPFLVGALTGGAAVGLTRPRPVYVNPGMMPQPYYHPYYQPYPYYYRPY